MTITGHVVQNDDGAYLSRSNLWVSHNTPEEAWVHHDRALKTVRGSSKSWAKKPTLITEASYTEAEDCTRILGEAQPF